MSVQHALLALLSEQPKFGLQLRQEFETRTGHVWPLNVGQVYTTLQRLERDGFIEGEDGETKGAQKDYKLTATGIGIPGIATLHTWPFRVLILVGVTVAAVEFVLRAFAAFFAPADPEAEA